MAVLSTAPFGALLGCAVGALVGLGQPGKLCHSHFHSKKCHMFTFRDLKATKPKKNKTRLTHKHRLSVNRQAQAMLNQSCSEGMNASGQRPV